VLHTGRQSLLPAVRGRVRRALPELPPGRDLLEPEHLKVCVAKGAALYGLMRGRLMDPTSGVCFLNEGRRLPHSYGVEKLTGLMRREFDEIIPRGATYPTRAERHYGPEMLRGSTLALKFYQNRSGRKTMVQNPGISLIGQVTVDLRTGNKPGCDVRFLIDANRKLEVYANEKAVEIIAARIKDEESWVG
jgi:molecular chaperone DnaK (HSP70)